VTTVLLLGAGGSAAANVLDALRRAQRGYRVVGADASPVKLHLSLADERVVIPRAGDTGYAGALVEVVEKFGCDVVHPQPDPDLHALSEIRDRIPAATYLPSPDALATAADKSAFAARMVQSAVPVPESFPIDRAAEVGAVTRDLLARHSRVWIRARHGAGARASLPVSTPEQAEAWVDWWIAERDLPEDAFMASEMLPGREFAYQSVWQDGELVVGQARERVEYLYGHLTPSGQTSTPSVARTVDEPRIDELAQHAIKALDSTPRGVYCVDIKESEAGEPKVTEINAGRFFTTANLFAAAGVNMPDMLVRCALGEHLPRLGSSPLPAGLFWIRMVDMGHALVPGSELHAWPGPGR
jgi:predicted ATP-grasp superfamily ATP-dependent carboligase